MPNPSNATAGRVDLQLESLEAREVPAILIQVDYTHDTGFFTNNPEARATMELAAAEMGASVTADLAAIVPSGGNTWTATYLNPSTGATQSLDNAVVGANTLRLFVGARPLGGGEAGYASTSGISASGTPGWVRTVETRNWNGFAPWGGSIAFDTTRPWYFGASADGLGARQLDFYSVALHELGHVLGIGTSGQWRSLSSGGAFRGSNAMSVYGGPVPLDADGLHWADGHSTSLDPSISYGERVGWSALDAAALRDIGWTAGGSTAASAAPAGTTLFTVAGANGVFTQYALRDGAVSATGKQFVPFPGFAGVLRQALGDVDGDGALDAVVATTGPGPAVFAVVSGLDGRVIGAPRLAHGAVPALLAADIDGDGRAEVIAAETAPGGGLAVYVYSVDGGAVRPYGRVSIFGEPGRAALRVAPDGTDRGGYGDAITAAPPSPAGESERRDGTRGHDSDRRPAREAAAPTGQGSPAARRNEPAADRADAERASDRDLSDVLFGGLWVG